MYCHYINVKKMVGNKMLKGDLLYHNNEKSLFEKFLQNNETEKITENLKLKLDELIESSILKALEEGHKNEIVIG